MKLAIFPAVASVFGMALAMSAMTAITPTPAQAAGYYIDYTALAKDRAKGINKPVRAYQRPCTAISRCARETQ